ncbi:hypothetical protein KY284_019634 [Solanum tuberosum]|nr:hypothetical protein KY284_019634 [Solanum tuberosum]
MYLQPGIVARKSSNSLLPYKKRYSLIYPHAPIHPSRNVDDLVKPALAKKLFGQEGICTTNVSSFGASVQEFNFPISSIHPSLRHKSANVLRVSLGSTLRGFNSSVLQSKSEPVEEANSGTAVRPDGTVEANLQSIELSTKELLEQEPMKCEPFMRSDMIAPQSVGRVLLLQESSSSTCSDLSVFAGHVDTESMGCVREDDIYEDGEIRELLMQSIAEDPMAEGMDSGTNKSYDDYVNGCDEKAEKNLHKDINLRSPLLDKKETTGDDEQRPIGADRSLSSRSGRERDEIYGYGPKFARDRFQDRSFDSPKGNFMRGRGRDWGHGRYSGSHFESYGDAADYHFRHKRTAAVWESANERNDYDSRLDGGAFASNRRRNLLSDTKFTPMQRSGFPRMWSRSPVRSRTWSLPSRRLTEGLNGREDLFQQRSPVMYREDRMRSSSRTSFTEEAIAPQRCDRPSYTARRQNDMRDVDDVQKYGHPRSLSSRGSPPDQVFTRTNRPRVVIFDHQERADGVGYFDGPIHTGRFPELHSGERRKYGERQMRNVKEQEGGNVRPRHEEEFDGSRLKKRRF